MPVPSKFDLMRRNRDRRSNLIARIDAIEAEVDAAWHVVREGQRKQRQAAGQDTVDWLRDMARQTRHLVPPQPRRRRRWWQFWKRK